MIWRTVRRTLVEDWFRPVNELRSQFDRILFHRLAEFRVAEGDLEPWHEYMLQEHPEGLQQLMEEISERLHLDRNTAIAFEHIAFGRHRRDLRAWLAGDSLPESALDRLGLSQDEGTDEEREDEAQRVVLMLCRLAGHDLPILLSFDQVEALQVSPDDTEGLFGFGKLVSILHDMTENVFVVSSVQSTFFGLLRERSRGADYDRMVSQGALSLDPLSPEEARMLIRARLDAAGAGVRGAESAANCWPLEEQEFADLFSQDRPVTPRRLLALCAERYESRLRETGQTATEKRPTAAPSVDGQSQAAIAASFLQDRWQEAVEAKRSKNSPELTEEIIRHGVPMLMPLIAPEQKLVVDEKLQDVPLVYDNGSTRIGLSVCTQANMTSLAARLRRLKIQIKSPRLQRLVLIRDSRVPVTPTANSARTYLDELQQAGAIVIHPSQEVLAALDALRELLSDAKSGDLACNGETFSPRTVEAWLREHLAEGLREFVEAVTGTSVEGNQAGTSATNEIESLYALLVDRPMLPLDEAARTLQRSAEELEQVARRHSDQIGILAGAPAVLFRVVNS
jgi:hypothetical protein